MTLDATGIALLSAGTFTTASTNFMIDASGNVAMKGSITADAGYIGGTGGFTIASAKLYSGKSTLTGTGAGVYVGTDGISLGGSGTPTFKVTAAGALTALSGVVGGFTIGENSLSVTSFALDAANKKITLGNITIESQFISGSPGTGYLKLPYNHNLEVYAKQQYYLIYNPTLSTFETHVFYDTSLTTFFTDVYFTGNVSALSFTDRP